MNITVGKQAIADASERLKNWGRWGKDDQIGTLNHVRPEDIVKAAALIKTGKVFGLGIPLDRKGPQTGLFGGRWNPIHTMLATGTDAVAGRQDVVPNIRYADDAINMPVQCATHWDSLGHIFYQETMSTATMRGWSTATASASSASNIRAAGWSGAACCSTSPASRMWTISRTDMALRMPSSTLA